MKISPKALSKTKENKELFGYLIKGDFLKISSDDNFKFVGDMLFLKSEIENLQRKGLMGKLKWSEQN